MIGSRLTALLAFLVMLVTPAPWPASADEPAPADPTDVGLLTISGSVLGLDGAPVAGASVESVARVGERLNTAQTDDQGRFRLDGVFGNGAFLHATTADGALQASRMIPAAAVRSASPIALTLAPSIPHEITVLSDDRPTPGVHVAARGIAFRVDGLTGEDGKVVLRFPEGEQLEGMVAWHPELGVDGVYNLGGGPPPASTQMALHPTRPHQILVVDPDGNPVEGLELGVSVSVADSGWIDADGVEAAHVRTDAEGAATVAWAPRESLEYVEINLHGDGWKIDQVDGEQVAEGITTVHVRRTFAVEGRLELPEGADAEGLLVTGFGFGPGNFGDSPHTRTRPDGGFTLRVPSDHAYVLGIADLEWASDPWSGVILGKDNWEPAEMALDLYPATPLIVRVTRGPMHEPVEDAWVHLSARGEVKWVDASGEMRSGSAGVGGWLRPDADGNARTGVGRGELDVRLSAGDWNEERTIEVDSGEPVAIEFHRPWLENRRIAGTLMIDGERFEPSPSVMARAWSPQRLEFEPEVHPDGTFDVAFDAETLSVFVLDPDRRRSGYAELGPDDTDVELNMEPIASYGGTLLDEDENPLADRVLGISLQSASGEAIVTQRTDESGRFRFAGVPAAVPLELDIEDANAAERSEYYLSGVDRLFEPGEVREDDRVTARRIGSDTAVAGPPNPLADRVERICGNVRGSGMRALVVLLGDDSQNVVTAAGRLLDYDEVEPALAFLTARVEAAQLDAEAATLDDHGWPRPEPGEVVLVALNGDQETIAARRIATERVDDAVSIGSAFLEEHGPPKRDALMAIEEARSTARSTGRRVWVVLGGPRCGPCFKLGRWMNDHHETLEKDYVIVKVLGGLDDHADEVFAELPESKGEGIPWHAITEPDGSVLVTSEGPLGNIGCPGSIEGLRHFRAMLDRTARSLTTDEVDGLIESLATPR